jgi:hypothetical protein
MRKFPILDLHSALKNGKLYVSAGEANNTQCNGTLTIVIADVTNGKPKVLTRSLTNLGYPLQEILFDDTPVTGKIHPVIATLVIDSGEIKKDDELIEFN